MNNKAIIITIGDELLIGQVIDTNSAWLGQQLNKLGIPVIEKIAISDSREGISSALDYATKKADIVLMTGGLGPTKDDITKKILAEYYGDDMVFHEETYGRVLELFARWGRSTTPAHREQCYMPSSASIITNKMGTAPAMLFDKIDHILVSMPGVPYEMKHLMEVAILPMLEERYLGHAIVHKTIRTAGEGESRIAAQIDHIVETLPTHMSIAYLPKLGQVRLRLTATGTDRARLEADVSHYSQLISTELGDLVFGYDTDTLVTAIGRLCAEKGKTIGTAESCTGGKVASIIVNQSGSSAFYEGSVVSYSNTLKQKLLGVRSTTLAKHGAVSEQTVKEMVMGATKILDVDVVVALSGIAGPSGGSEEKPVGTIWLACGTGDHIETMLLKAGKNREKNIEYAATYALDLMRRYLQSI